MEKFIYVFDTAARDKLLGLGFVLVGGGTQSGIFVFENSGDVSLLDGEMKYILSNTLVL